MNTQTVQTANQVRKVAQINQVATALANQNALCMCN